tara:strand:- start:10448 stop:11029 length:582 start_codon:yes stop_codon:yes gene_type:complete
MHEIIFTVDPIGVRVLHLKVNWGGDVLQPTWIHRVSADPEKGDGPVPWGPLPLFNSKLFICPCKTHATPFYFKGALRTAALCGHFLKSCDGCRLFFVTKRKWDAVCGGCHNAFFCSKACQARTWPDHRLHCCGKHTPSPADLPLTQHLARHLETLDDATLHSLETTMHDANNTIHNLRRINAALIKRLQELQQ